MANRASPLFVRPLDDETLQALYEAWCVNFYKGEPAPSGWRRLARLVEAEIQGQILTNVHNSQRRASEYAARKSRKNETTTDSQGL